MTDSIVYFSEYENLKSEVERLRTELSMLVLERDELKLVVCKDIEMKYMLGLGAIEYRVFETECTCRRLKRKVEMIQAKKNRQEKVDIAAIDRQLDIEFAEYQQQLNEHISRMNKALDRSKCDYLSDNDAAELKKLYRRIVKALHPDLHPDLSQEKKELFIRALKAYENGDLQALRVIDAMITDDTFADTQDDPIKALADERDRLQKLIKGVQESIAKIKSEYPYTLLELVVNEDKKAARKKELEKIQEANELAIVIYKELIAGL